MEFIVCSFEINLINVIIITQQQQQNDEEMDRKKNINTSFHTQKPYTYPSHFSLI